MAELGVPPFCEGAGVGRSVAHAESNASAISKVRVMLSSDGNGLLRGSDTSWPRRSAAGWQSSGKFRTLPRLELAPRRARLLGEPHGRLPSIALVFGIVAPSPLAWR